MHAKLTFTALGICLLVGTVAARRANRSWFEARTTGAAALTLRGRRSSARWPVSRRGPARSS